jgi:3D (Asp-Asp-Asp) domain-containing protein
MSHRIVTTLDEGATVKVAAGPVSDGGEDWYQISVGTSTTGWSVGRYLGPSSAASSSTRFTTTAVNPTVRAMSISEGRRTFVAKITAYANGVGGIPRNARTASGTPTRWGVVAVDPKVIPLGSTLQIEGYEGTTFVAEDVGGAIKGHTLDIWLPDPKEAKRYGTKHRRVTILREGPAR